MEKTEKHPAHVCLVFACLLAGFCGLAAPSYAANSKPSYTIHYDANGGYGAPSDQRYSYGETPRISSAVPSRAGYTFTGWTGTIENNKYVADAYNGQSLTLSCSNTVWPARTLSGAEGANWEMQSTTNLDGLVRRIYFYSYGRQPTTNEQTTWVGALRAGTANVQDFATMAFADPAVSSRYCASCLVDRLYAALLNRDPDWSGKCYWAYLGTNDSSGYGVGKMVEGVVFSSEFLSIANSMGIKQGSRNTYAKSGNACYESGCANRNDGGFPASKGRRYDVFSSSVNVITQPYISSAGLRNSFDTNNFVAAKTLLLDTAKVTSDPSWAGYHKSVPAGVYEGDGRQYFQWIIHSMRQSLTQGSNINTLELTSGIYNSGWYYNVHGVLIINKWFGLQGSTILTSAYRAGSSSFSIGTGGGSIPGGHNGNVTLRANWSMNPTPTAAPTARPTAQPTSKPTTPPSQSIRVYYDANGGSGGPGSGSGTYGTTYLIAQGEPTRSGYTFIGWSTSSSGSAMYNYNAYGSYTGPMTDRFTLYNTTYLYAIWEQASTTLHVYYDANGGSGGPSSGSGTYGATYLIAQGEPTRSGYTFIGWSTTSSGSAMYNYNAYGSYTGPMTDRFTLYGTTYLYAIWEKRATTYTVSYNPNGGSGIEKTYSVGAGATHSIISWVPTRSGYSFLGWSASASATSASYTYGDSLTINSDKTFYAVWGMVATHAITYHANNGTTETHVESAAEGASYAVSGWLPTRDRYEFVQWRTSPDGTGTAYHAGDHITITGDFDLYAEWRILDSLNAEIKNITAVSPLKDTNTFRNGEKGAVKFTLTGEITRLEISYPQKLRDYEDAGGKDQLESVSIYPGDASMEGDGESASGHTEFYIPVNFPDADAGDYTVEVKAIYADGKTITQTPGLKILPRADVYRFHTRVL